MEYIRKDKIEQIKNEINQWKLDPDKQELSGDSDSVNIMIKMFTRLLDRALGETYDEEWWWL